jgi:hypothetical protein
MTHTPSSHEIRALTDAEIDAVAGGVGFVGLPSGIFTAELILSPLFIPGNPIIPPNPIIPGNPIFVFASSPQSVIIDTLFGSPTT